jgi:hypothetical protein
MTHREMFPHPSASPWGHSKKSKNFAIASCGLIRFRIDHGHQRGGRLAQLVERLVYTEDVGGSSPSSPTKSFFARPCLRRAFCVFGLEKLPCPRPRRTHEIIAELVLLPHPFEELEGDADPDLLPSDHPVQGRRDAGRGVNSRIVAVPVYGSIHPRLRQCSSAAAMAAFRFGKGPSRYLLVPRNSTKTPFLKTSKMICIPASYAIDFPLQTTDKAI